MGSVLGPATLFSSILFVVCLLQFLVVRRLLSTADRFPAWCRVVKTSPGTQVRCFEPFFSAAHVRAPPALEEPYPLVPCAPAPPDFNISQVPELQFIFDTLMPNRTAVFWVPRTASNDDENESQPNNSSSETNMAYLAIPPLSDEVIARVQILRTLFVVASTVVLGLAIRLWLGLRNGETFSQMFGVVDDSDGMYTLVERLQMRAGELSADRRRRRRKKKRRLKREERIAICDRYEVHEEIDGWTCSVCLEGADDEEDDPERADELLPGGTHQAKVKLPCQHLFHRHCLYRWCKKGRSVCPLCNDDLLRYVGEATEPASQGQESAQVLEEDLSRVVIA